MKDYLKQIAKSEGLGDVTKEMAEKAIDEGIENEVVREIPVLKTIVALKNAYTSISDGLFIKKAMRVLLEMGELEEKERDDFIEDLSDDKGDGAEKILLAIDHIETMEKCEVFGRLCRIRAERRISKEDFHRLTKVIQDGYIEDLKLIKKFYEGKLHESSEEEVYPLKNLGLISFSPPTLPDIDATAHGHTDKVELRYEKEQEFHFELTDVGSTLIDVYDDLFLEGVDDKG